MNNLRAIKKDYDQKKAIILKRNIIYKQVFIL